MPWTADDVPSMEGKTVVVTGANTGIGYHAARVFAEKGADVTLACRSVERGEEAADGIRGGAPDGSVDVRELDLASLASVEGFADRFTDDHDALDVLCNNAGVMAIPRRETEDGFEQQFGVNHLGHFALTARLSDLLVSTDGARVVTTSSGAHERGEIRFDDLHGEKEYSQWGAYAQSKLANLLFAFELQRRFEDAGVDAKSIGVHPGYADTDLQRRGPEMEGSRLKLGIMKAMNAVVAQSAERGALPILYAATAETEGGVYVGPGGFMNMRGYPEVQEPNESTRDEETARRLWEASEGLTGVGFEIDS
jgi:NAD(P)-dependent dehydrogenase (short-subunit alcohol dehydrogenase family)